MERHPIARMNRFFTDDIAGGAACITGDDVKHIARVLRLGIGDAVTVCDGAGTDYDAVITGVSDAAVTLSLGPARPAETEPHTRITLFQGLPKAGKMETIIQKCVELGISEIAPVTTRRCVAEPGKDFEKKRIRYQRVALEAAKQSRRGRIPTVLPTQALENAAFSRFGLVLLAYEDERGTTLKEALRRLPSAPESAALIVGPEGGFAPEEVAALTERGAVCVSLGRRILRTETAGMAMLAQVLYEWE